MQHVETSPEEKRDNSWSRSRWLFVGLGAVIIGLLAGWAVLTLVDATYTYHGTVIQSPDPVRGFTLQGADGEPVSLADFRGKVVLLYFGYTFCPDVCPSTMVELAKAKQLLGKDGDRAQVIMVSVDPARDTPEKLNQYVTHFDPSFLGLTGTEDAIAEASTPFGIFYEKREGSEATGYLIDHTASVVAIDPEGHLRLIYPFGTDGEDIAEDINHLLR